MKLYRLVLIFLVAISVGFGGVAMAGDGHGHGHGNKHHKKKWQAKWEKMSDEEKQEFVDKRIDRRLERLDAKLELSDDQKAQIRQILEQTHTEMRTLKNQDGERKAKRGQMREIFKQTHQEIASVLDDDQLDTYEELVTERRKRFQHRRRHKRQKRGGNGH